LKFYSSLRIDVRRVASIKEGEQVTGSQVKARVVKNKVAPPFRETHFDIMFDSGISREGDLLDLATKHTIVEKQGAWLRYGNIQLGQGRENAKTFLRDNPDLCKEITRKILEINGLLTPAKDAKAEETKSADSKSPAASDNGRMKAPESVSKSAPLAKGRPPAPIPARKPIPAAKA
jgi:recombination protein RecA